MTEVTYTDILITEALLPTGASSLRYEVRNKATGEVLIPRSRDPEFETARLLLERGVEGWYRTFRPGSDDPAFVMLIENASKLTTTEPSKSKSGIKTYVEHPLFAAERANEG